MGEAIPLGRRERKKLAVRDKIIEEALGLIALHGVDGTTIDAICDCADIAKKTFYNYYSAKHDLVADICQENLLNRTPLLIDEAMARTADLAGQLEYILRVMAERNRSAGKLERELIGYMVGNLSENRDQGAGQLTFMNECFYRLFEAAKRQLVPGLSSRFCAEMTVGMLNGLTLNWLHNDDYDTEDRFRQLLTYLKHSMLQRDRDRSLS